MPYVPFRLSAEHVVEDIFRAVELISTVDGTVVAATIPLPPSTMTSRSSGSKGTPGICNFATPVQSALTV
jgi:hypothetical protein